MHLWIIFFLVFLNTSKSHTASSFPEYKNIFQQSLSYTKSKVPLLIVDTDTQQMHLFNENTKFIQSYTVSTGKNGEGSQKYSRKTPLGFHKINEKIGANAPIGTIFKAKINTRVISEIFTDQTDLTKDPVITRILSLTGLQQGYNSGGNIDSYSRGIFIHGTHEEGLIGTKASNGCIRMYNNDIVQLFNKIPLNTIVFIHKKTSP